MAGNKLNYVRNKSWLPTSLKEIEGLGWDYIDVILFTGDAYVDHPSFGAAVIGRVLESMGLRVAVVPQPNWRDDLRDFKKFGSPRLFSGVTSGSMDSMVNHYTANRRLRSNDAYTPGGLSGFRPDYAAYEYSRILKSLFPGIPVILGGIEASLRRFTHYDYWSDRLMPGILFDNMADMVIYGMGEKPVREIASLMMKGVPFESLKTIPQTAIQAGSEKNIPPGKKWGTLTLHSHEACLEDPLKFAENFVFMEEESNRLRARRLIQEAGGKFIVVNPPYPPLSEREMDEIYDLPYTRLPHPRYLKKGKIPAYEMIRHSINIHRGCFGGCGFCTISAHQGRHVSSRSLESVMREADTVSRMDDFRGHITDLGGPTANMYRMEGRDRAKCMDCSRPSCIYPSVCGNLSTDINPLLILYRAVRSHPSVKKAAIGSGIRYDMFFNRVGKIEGKNLEFVTELMRFHVSGRLKVAPEHTSPGVLKLMRKPSFEIFQKFRKHFEEINSKWNLREEIVPYFISGHPGSGSMDMACLVLETKKMNFKLEQVQNFMPTPMTLASVMYYTGSDPYTGEKLHVARGREEKMLQQSFFFWYKKENRERIIRELKRIGKTGLISKIFR